MRQATQDLAADRASIQGTAVHPGKTGPSRRSSGQYIPCWAARYDEHRSRDCSYHWAGRRGSTIVQGDEVAVKSQLRIAEGSRDTLTHEMRGVVRSSVPCWPSLGMYYTCPNHLYGSTRPAKATDRMMHEGGLTCRCTRHIPLASVLHLSSPT